MASIEFWIPWHNAHKDHSQHQPWNSSGPVCTTPFFHRPSTQWWSNSSFNWLTRPSFIAAYRWRNSEPNWSWMLHWMTRCRCGKISQKPHCEVLDLRKWPLQLPLHDKAIAVQHILQENNLETGVFMARALVSLDWTHAHNGEPKASGAAKNGQKHQRRIIKQSQDEKMATEGLQNKAGEF